MRVLVTGATGFVGRAVVSLRPTDDIHFRAAVRRASPPFLHDVEHIQMEDMSARSVWSPALADIDTVVHAAARVHLMHDSASDPLTEYRAVNVVGTLNLARQAADAGVRRFIFISSIKVNGERTVLGHPYTADDAPDPADPYGISKREAEDELRALSHESGLEVVIIRPVLVYGPGVKANFQSMMRWLGKGIPLPLGAVDDNRRSLVALDNLVDLIGRCLTHPSAANQTFLVSDGEDLSTADLLRRTATALGTQARLIPVPVVILQSAAHLLGKWEVANRLCGSLQVDIAKTRMLLDWTPPVSVDMALARTAEHYLGHEGR